MTGRHLWRHGAIHSAEFPFATAIEFTDGVITWIGDEDTADARAGACEVVVDCEGGVVLPAFVDAGAFLRGRLAEEWVSAWPQHGIIAGSVRVTADEVRQGKPRELVRMAQSAGGWVECVVSDDVELALDLAEHVSPAHVAVHITTEHGSQVARSRDKGLRTIVDVRDLGTEGGAAVVASAPHHGLPALRWWSGIRWVGQLPDLSQTGALSLTWLVEPRQDAAQGLENGLNTVLTLSQVQAKCDPWSDIAAATAQGSSWSGRSVIRALTRSAWRAWGEQSRGELAVGQVAAMAIWRGSEGADVVAPRGQLAPWSVEAQSGMPVLPVSAVDAGPSLTRFVAY